MRALKISPFGSSLFAISALLIPAIATSATEEACGGYTIAFGNGILNSDEDRDDSRLALRAELGDELDGLPVGYTNAVDPTNGPWTDLVTVLQQKVDEYGSSGLTWGMAIEVFLGLSPSGAAPLWISAIQTAVQQMGLSAVVDLLNDVNDGDTIIATTLGNHLSLYEELVLEERQRVLVVAHSQGTIYANAAYEALGGNPNFNRRSIAIVSAAALVDEISDGKSRYVTSSNDHAVNALRLVFPGAVLPANTTNEFAVVDPLGHNFVDTYLRVASPARAQLVAKSQVALADLESNEWTVEQPLAVFTRYIPNWPWCSELSTLTYSAAFPLGTATFLGLQLDSVAYGTPMPDPMTFDFRAQRYQDTQGAVVSETAFAAMLDNTGQMSVIKDLDASGMLVVVNGQSINSVAYAVYTDPVCGAMEMAVPTGTTPSNMTAQYDSLWLEPQLTLIKTFPNVRTTKILQDWPQKTVAIKVCEAPPL